VVFTVGLGIALVYWLFVLLGALDIDLFHGGDVGGGADGIGDVGGHIDVGGHDVGGGDVGGHDVGGHDAGDGGGDGGDHDAGDSGSTGLWHALGLGAIPLTISVSVILLICWCGSLLVMNYLGGDYGKWLAAIVLPGMIIVAIPFAALLLRPLAPVFKLKEGKSNRDYIGHICTITTGHVDDGFGQATLEDGGNVLEIPVRCDRAGLGRGHKALIIDFDSEREAYVVEPSADMIAEPAKGDAT
jgi:hypothetical protein